MQSCRGRLQRVCLASVLALEPRLLLLDEPTSALDPEGAEEAIGLARAAGAAVVVSEQRPDRVLPACDRVLFLERGRVVLDAPREEALAWLARHRPAWVPREAILPGPGSVPEPLCRVEHISFAYGNSRVLEGVSLEIGRGEVVALVGPTGSGKTTLAKLAAGLLEPNAGVVTAAAGVLPLQDPPDLARERAEEEVASRWAGSRARARGAARGGLRMSPPTSATSRGRRDRLAPCSRARTHRTCS